MRRSRAIAVAILAATTGAVLALDVTGVLRGPLNSALNGNDFADTRTVDPQLTLATPVPVLAPLSSVSSPVPSAAGVTAALDNLLAAPALGDQVRATVLDVATGTVLLDQAASTATIPASTTKVLTATAALATLGPDTRLSTRVVDGGNGSIVLVGAGDATLRSTPSAPGDGPTLTTLAERTAQELKKQGRTSVTLAYDTSLFKGSTVAKSWPKTYVESGVVAPVMALSVDNARVDPKRDDRQGDPAKSAAARFAALLKQEGITTTGAIDSMTTTSAAPLIGEVLSSPMSSIVERMLTASDNDIAEALGHLVGAKAGDPTFAGGARTTLGVLGTLNVSTAGIRLLDASGLSRDNLIPPAALVQTVAVAAQAEHPELRGVLTGLPVGGLNGTLDDRFRGPVTKSAAGEVRGKTGTLTGVTSLSGTVVDADGRLLAFAVMADRVPAGGNAAAEAAIDRVVARLADCGCA